MGWTIYNSLGEVLVTQEQHDHTTADASGPMTDDEHDGFSEYAEITAPANPAANKGRLYSIDRNGDTTLQWRDSAGVLAEVTHAPTVKLRQTTLQSIVADAVRQVTMQTTDWDSLGNMADLANNQIIIRQAGIYIVHFGMNWVGTGATTARFAGIGLNATAFNQGVIGPIQVQTGSESVRQIGSNILELSVNDTLELVVFSRTTTLNSRVSEGMPLLAATWVAP